MFQSSSPEKIQTWKEKILLQQQSDLSIERWCHKNQVVVCQFYYWKRRLFPKQITASSFTELSHVKEVGVTIECDGIQIHLNPDFDAVTLKRCLAVIKEARC
jgi:hypothetical protein